MGDSYKSLKGSKRANLYPRKCHNPFIRPKEPEAVWVRQEVLESILDDYRGDDP